MRIFRYSFCMRQRGNILFLILLAVILFAALSYAVTSSMRGGGKDASKETPQAAAAHILQTLDQVNVAVTRMHLSQNLPYENISFEYIVRNSTGGSWNTWANPTCTSDNCRVFKPGGGGAAPSTFYKFGVANATGWDPGWHAPGSMYISVLQWPHAKTSANDVVMTIAAIDPNICNEINRNLDIAPVPTFTGNLIDATNPANWDNTTAACATNCSTLAGKNVTTVGSTVAGNGNSCNLYYLIIPR